MDFLGGVFLLEEKEKKEAKEKMLNGGVEEDGERDESPGEACDVTSFPFR
jgi:hypothetical protein